MHKIILKILFISFFCPLLIISFGKSHTYSIKHARKSISDDNVIEQDESQ